MNEHDFREAQVRVYVHLARGFDARRWRERWSSSELVGLNDETPYGYHRAEGFGAVLTYSADQSESASAALVRKAIRVVLGFDLLHAWRNRGQMFAADVVWTHTESQHLAVAAVLRILGRGKLRRARPRLIAQSVWLFDSWEKYSRLRKAFYRQLMAAADVLTVLSSVNCEAARVLFPNHRVEFVPFGISVDAMVGPCAGADGALNVLSVGNDRHRDWETLLRAVAMDPADLHLKIVSGTVDRRLAARYGVDTVRPTSNLELHRLYDWADVVVVPLRQNKHASGITAILEAVVLGIPVVVTDAGGLRDYLTDVQVAYVNEGEPSAIAQALKRFTSSDLREQFARKAQEALGCPGLSSKSYALRHVELSRDILDLPGRTE